MKIIIPKREIVLSDQEIIERTLLGLRRNYICEIDFSRQGGYRIGRAPFFVAKARVEDGQVSFDIGDDVFGQHFKEDLFAVYKIIDPDRIWWKGFFNLNGSWTHSDNLVHRSKELAFAGLDGMEISREAMVCSFYRKSWDNELIMRTLTSFRVWDKLTLGNTDEGPIQILMRPVEGIVSVGKVQRPIIEAI